jgi:hypothetical protein
VLFIDEVGRSAVSLRAPFARVWCRVRANEHLDRWAHDTIVEWSLSGSRITVVI